MPAVAGCPSCGAENDRGQRFCNMCGAGLIESSGAPQPALAGAVGYAAPPLSREWLPAPTPKAALFPESVPLQLVAAVSLVFAVAVFVRFYGLGDIPAELLPVEEAVRAAVTGIRLEGWTGMWVAGADAQPAGFAYLLAAWGSITGEGVSALRGLSAALGISTVGVFYLFCRYSFGARVALMATVLLAFSGWHLVYARITAPGALTALLVLVAAYTMLLALDEAPEGRLQRGLLAVSGGCFAATLFVSSAFLVFVPVVLFWWGREVLAGEYPIGEVLRRSRAFFVPAGIVALTFVVVAGGPGRVVRELGSVTVFTTDVYHEQNDVTEQTRHILANTGRTVQALLWKPGDGGGRLLDPLTALLAAIGFIAGGWRLRERKHYIVWAMLAGTVLAAGFTTDSGLYGRLTVALPAVFVLAAVTLDWLIVRLEGRATTIGAYAVVAALVGLSSMYSLVSFYGDWSESRPQLWAGAVSREGEGGIPLNPPFAKGEIRKPGGEWRIGALHDEGGMGQARGEGRIGERYRRGRIGELDGRDSSQG